MTLEKIGFVFFFFVALVIGLDEIILRHVYGRVGTPCSENNRQECVELIESLNSKIALHPNSLPEVSSNESEEIPDNMQRRFFNGIEYFYQPLTTE